MPVDPPALDAAGALSSALTCFDDLDGRDALAVLAVAPTPLLGRSLSLSKIASALRRGERQRRVEDRSAEIQAALRGDELAALVAVIVEFQRPDRPPRAFASITASPGGPNGGTAKPEDDNDLDATRLPGEKPPEE